MLLTLGAARDAAALRRQLELAGAMAREALLDAHTTLATSFVALGKGRVPERRMLRIYGRLHGLHGPAAAAVEDRVLAALARSEGRAAPAPAEDREKLLARVLRRLRGRSDPELREWVELHSGHASVELVRVHVRQALRFVELLDGRSSPTTAVAEYCEQTGVPPQLADTIRILVLNHLAQLRLPRVPGEAPAAEGGAAGATPPPRPFPAAANGGLNPPARPLRLE